MTNKRNGTLYIGATSDLAKRVWEHKNKLVPGFTSKYDLSLLVYYECVDDWYSAFNREKQLKKWNRKWKLELIEKTNPNWIDLYDSLLP